MIARRPAINVARTVARGTVRAVLATVLALSGAAVVVRLIPAEHTAVAVVAPAVPPSLAPPVEGGGRAGGGADDPAPVPGPFLRALELLSGGALAGDLAADPEFLAAVLGGAAVGSLAATVTDLVALAIGRPGPDRPDADLLRGHLRTRFRIEQTAQPGLRRLSYRHRDPHVAEAVIARAVAAADARLRGAASDRATVLVADLRRRLADGTGPTDRRIAMATLLEEQERRVVLLTAGLPVAIEFVQPPTAGARPDDTDPRIVLVLVALVGVAAGLWPILRRAGAGR